GGNGPSPNPSSAKPTPSTSLPNPQPSSQKPQPSQSTPAPSKNPMPSPSSNPSPAPQPPSGDCGSCTNCYYAPTQSCFAGWTAAQCASVSDYKWCGSSAPSPITPGTSRSNPKPSSKHPKPSPSTKPSSAPQPPKGDCGSCNNCYYAPTQACFAGWTAEQCASVSDYKWCGSGGPNPSPPKPSSSAPSPPSNKPTQKPSSRPPSPPTPSNKPSPNPSPSSAAPSPGGDYTVSWNWFASSTTDCDASLSKDTLNRGLYIGGENIPADCGKTATFSYNGKTVTATYAWRTTGGQKYHELSPQAFAKLLGSSANAANFNSAPEFQAAINDPGHVTAQCTGGKC
ncbi:hypothetical protein As57867_005139, partial [Aphanomyces stellatus]